MKHAYARKLVACSLATAFAVAVSVPGFAAERPASGSTSSTLLASGQKQVQQLVAIPAAGQVARQEGTAGSGYDTPGTFFKTRRGIAVLLVAAAGIGYMWYSKVNDRIHSVERERQDN